MLQSPEQGIEPGSAVTVSETLAPSSDGPHGKKTKRKQALTEMLANPQNAALVSKVRHLLDYVKDDRD